MSNEISIKGAILLILVKCIVVDIAVGCSNGNESFTGRLFPSYRPLNMLFHFFRYLIYSVFHETVAKKFKKKLSFFCSNFKNPFQDIVYYWKLRCITLWYWYRSFEYKVKSWKMCPFLGLSFRNKKTLTFWIFMNEIFR